MRIDKLSNDKIWYRVNKFATTKIWYYRLGEDTVSECPGNFGQGLCMKVGLCFVLSCD